MKVIRRRNASALLSFVKAAEEPFLSRETHGDLASVAMRGSTCLCVGNVCSGESIPSDNDAAYAITPRCGSKAAYQLQHNKKKGKTSADDRS
jgi:hypothetical protein